MNIAKPIWELMLGIMKSQLKLAEFGFGGRENDNFRTFKEYTMNSFYDGTKKFFQQGVTDGVFEKCSCSANLRHGYDKDCDFCHGSGYKDIK